MPRADKTEKSQSIIRRDLYKLLLLYYLHVIFYYRETRHNIFQ